MLCALELEPALHVPELPPPPASERVPLPPSHMRRSPLLCPLQRSLPQLPAAPAAAPLGQLPPLSAQRSPSASDALLPPPSASDA